MAYTKTTWKNGDTITAEKLNNMESGIADALPKSETPTKLPNPNKLTFTGGASATYDGSSAVTVNIPSGGGGSGSVAIDATLTQSGQAADAKAVGDALADKMPTDTVIPSKLSDLSDDETHRTVTDTEKATWNGKSDFSGAYNDLSGKPETLSNPHALTFTGAASGTYDGSSPVTINIPSVGSAGETSSGWELIEIKTVEESVNVFSFPVPLDDYGFIYFKVAIAENDAEFYFGISFSASSTFAWDSFINEPNVPANYPYYFRGMIFNQNQGYNFMSYGKASRYENNARFDSSMAIRKDKFKYISFLTNSSGVNIPIGTTIELWGIKKGGTK